MDRNGLLSYLAPQCLALACLVTAIPVGAQNWPVRPVRMVVAFPPGGVADIPRTPPGPHRDGRRRSGRRGCAGPSPGHRVSESTAPGATTRSVGRTSHSNGTITWPLSAE